MARWKNALQTKEEIARLKRQAVLRESGRIFSRRGFHNTSLADVAEQLAVSKGTLYNYFEGKSDLFIAYVERESDRKIAWILDLADAEGDVTAALNRVGRRLTRTLLSDSARTMHRILIAEAPKFPDLARTYFEAGHGRGCREMARWLARQSEAGRLRIDDPSFAAEQFAALCRTRFWAPNSLHILPDVSDAEIDAVVARNVAMFLRSYGPEPRDPPCP